MSLEYDSLFCFWPEYSTKNSQSQSKTSKIMHKDASGKLLKSPKSRQNQADSVKTIHLVKNKAADLTGSAAFRIIARTVSKEQFVFFAVRTNFFQHGVGGCQHQWIDLPGMARTNRNTPHAGNTEM